MQFLGTAVVCMSERQSFKKAKERWDNASLGAKDFKSDYAKEQLKGRASQRKEVLSKVLRKTLEARV
jgi:hypothetical protein